jgi:hemoglobin/transferrin/lactoferrin receptor protein
MFNVGVNLYYTLLDKFITRAPFDITANTEGHSTIDYDGETGLAVVANVNKGSAFVKGGTLSFQGDINQNWFTRGGATYTYGRTYVSRDPLSSIPPLFCDFSLGYRAGKFESIFKYEYSDAKSADEYNIYEGIDNIEETPIVDSSATNPLEKYAGTPSWQTFNLSLLYDVNSNMNVHLRVQNLLDSHYKEFASGLSAAGRNFSASVRYLF